VANERIRKLLVLLAILVGLRFVVLPWIESQSATRDEVSVLTKRLDRSQSLLANEELIKKTDQYLTNSLRGVRSRFPSHGSVDSFKLEMQPKIGEVAQLNGMTINLFTWVLDGEVKDAGLRFVRTRVQLTGSLAQLAAFQGQLEGDMPNVFIREIAIAGNSAGVMPGDVLGTLTLTADLYFRSNAAAPTKRM
jgi:hypothetical protein